MTPIDELEKFLFFDESGDPVNGVGRKKLVFFTGCVHTDDINKVNKTYSDICHKLNTGDFHYANLTKNKQIIAWQELLKSDLKLDVAIAFTNNFQEMKTHYEEMENKKQLFEFRAGAIYKKFDEMCQTEMYAKTTWLIFVKNDDINHPDYEKPLKDLSKIGCSPTIQYDPASRVNKNVWQKTDLDNQIKKYNLKTELQPIKSEGTKLADILVSGFSARYSLKITDFFKRNHPKYSIIPISKFFTDGKNINLIMPKNDNP